MSNTWVIGAGGLGKAIAEHHLASVHNVHLFSRTAKEDLAISLNCQSPADIEQNIVTYGLPQQVVITTGILHEAQNHPEKSLMQLKPEWLAANFEANLMPSLFILQALTHHLNQKHIMKVACFSARVASISDNRLGGWHSYRMSKAALNMLVKNVALEWRFKSPNSCVVAYHPGTVDTPLSKPFQKNVPDTQLFTAHQAAEYFWQFFEQLSAKQSGCLFDWQGLEIQP